MSSGNPRRRVELDEDTDAVVVRDGIKVEFNTGGSVTVYTNGDVKVRPAVNDDAKPRAKTAPEIGDTMEDGTIFAGISPDTGRRMYTRPADTDLTMKWREAMNYAANLNARGHRDWKLPSKAELNVLFKNRAAIGGFDTSGSFPAGYYWSSSKISGSNAWYQRFSDGFQNANNKNGELCVRCVRR
jgi:hypothetical protein